MIQLAYQYQSKLDQFAKPYKQSVRRWLTFVGGYTRKVAKNSLKKAKRKRNEDELTDEELDYHVIKTRQNEAEGKEPPLFPERVSKPGMPPLVHGERSPLKVLLLYAVDEREKEATIGPARAASAIAGNLEHGHGKQLPRPFMRPAQEKTRPRMSAFWADSIR
jgi:hypothetical protein